MSERSERTVEHSAPQATPAGWRSLAPDLRPLRRHRDLRLLLASRGISFLGSMVTYVAVPFQVYELTGSTLAVGLVGLGELVTLLALAFLGGALADAKDRRLLVLSAEAGLALCSAVLLGNALLDRPNVAAVFVVAAVMAGLDAIQRPALEALIPRLVDRDELAATSALSSLEMTVAMVVGPGIAGLLIATAGLGATFGFDLATFLLSLVLLSLMKAVPPPEDAERPSLRRVAEGFRYAWSRQELLGSYLVDVVAMFFGMPFALFPAIADRYGGGGVVGLLYAAPSVGSLLATLTSGWVPRVSRYGRAILWAAGAWGVAIVAFGLAPTLPLALVALVAAGAADMVSGMFRMTLWNSTIPDALRGRLASIELVSYSSGPLLGNAESGIAASLIGVRGSVVSGGALCIVGVVATAVLLPGLARYDSRRETPLAEVDA